MISDFYSFEANASGPTGTAVQTPPRQRRKRASAPAGRRASAPPPRADNSIGPANAEFEIARFGFQTSGSEPLPSTSGSQFLNRHSDAGPGSGKDYVVSLYLRDVSFALASAGRDATTQTFCAASNRERLVLSQLRSVVFTAYDYRGSGLPMGDLINEGNLGLMRAAQLFNPLRNVRFSHYAQPWIRVHMDRAVSYQAWPVNFPADFNWRHSRVARIEGELKAKLDRAPSDDEVAAECGMKTPTVHRLRSTRIPTFLPIDSSLPSDEPGLTVGETIPDENAPAPDREAARASDRQFLSSLLRILSPTEQKVIRLRYGLDDGCARTLQEVAKLLGYVRQGIHRLETVALKRLRQHASLVAQGQVLI